MTAAPNATDQRLERDPPCGPCKGTGQVKIAKSCTLELVEPITWTKVRSRRRGKRKKDAPAPETEILEALEFQRAKLRHLVKIDGLATQAGAGRLMELLTRQPSNVINQIDPQDLPLVALAIGIVSAEDADDLSSYVDDPDELDELLGELLVEWDAAECVHCAGTGRPLAELEDKAVRLQVPIDNQGEELAELRFWRPDFGTIRQAGAKGGELTLVFELLKEVCRLTDRAVGEIDPVDLPAIAEVVQGFFSKRRRIGR